MNARFTPRLAAVLTCVAVVAILLIVGLAQSPRKVRAASPPPNILFIILDDVGIDQLPAFNPAAPVSPKTPNLDTIVAGGVKFTNFWTMPECSPSRACFFTGRYPLRTGVDLAFTGEDLPAAQVSPFEVTTPRVLRTAGYTSALIGKFHLAGPENNPDGIRTPAVLGWDYYNGILQGVPPSIDTTLGGQIQDKTKYPYGFPTGNQRGACWFQSPDGQVRVDDNTGQGYTGQECVTRGGIPALDSNGNFARTAKEAAHTPDFTKLNAYYVWPKVVNDESGAHQSTAREYMTTAQTSAAIEWIQRQSQGPNAGRPWMCTVSYNCVHTPYQHPPSELYPPGFTWPSNIPGDSTGLAAQRVLGDLMIEAMDQEIGRLLVSTGLAQRGSSGELVYRPEATNTMIIIAGDNGTNFSLAKLPYDPGRSKGTPYETGVRAPLVVAGPLVHQPGRTVAQMANCVDLFQLFGEIAGVDVRAVVPASHVLDSQPMLAYLTNPNQPGIRRYNFTQLGLGVKATSVHAWPGVFSNGPLHTCNDTLFSTQGVAEDNGATWYGPTPEQPKGTYASCCDVRAANIYPSLTILPTRVWALRNERYKLVKNERVPCDRDQGEFEFYDLKPTALNPVGLDLMANNLLTNGQPVNLTAEQMASFQELMQAMNAVLNSEPVCHGDGNLDKVVDQQDLDAVHRYWGQPSVYDFNRDGTTDQKDLDCVQANLGHNCLAGSAGTPCN
jgi:arylsulfatase A-like enzyme